MAEICEKDEILKSQHFLNFKPFTEEPIFSPPNNKNLSLLENFCFSAEIYRIAEIIISAYSEV